MSKVRKILIVDDDSDDQVLLIEALRDLDATTKFQTATNGHHALELLHSSLHELPDLVFLDLNMPRMNGIQFLLEVKQRQELRAVRVIIYSTSSDQKDMAETARLGAEHFITKPTGLSELKLKLRSLLTHEWAH